MKSNRRLSPQTGSVLIALADRHQKWRYGYDLCRETGLKAGTMYPILMRLAEQGLLETEWEKAITPGRPPRHMYRLSVTGRALAAQVLGEVKQRDGHKSVKGSLGLEGAT